MRSTILPTRDAAVHASRSDARLAVGAVLVAVVGFSVLVVLPYALASSTPPPGVDVLWRVGGPLAVVLCPLAAGLAAAASLMALLRGGLAGTTRRLHVTTLVAAAALAALLASAPGQSVLTWWRD